jgi:hypothetical protein
MITTPEHGTDELEALIEEARRRQRRRQGRASLVVFLLVGAAVWIVAGGGGGGHRGVSRPAAAGRAAPAPRSHKRAPAFATNPELAYETGVNPGSALAFASGSEAFMLASQPVPWLDQRLSAGPSGKQFSWPSSAVLGSTDGGRTWRRSLSLRSGLWGLDFVDAEHGWAVGVTGLYRTNDGGAQWMRAGEGGAGGENAIVRVLFTSPRTGFALTTRGRLLRSLDGGETWSRTVWHGRGGALCAPSPGALVVADQSGAIWQSVSGGNSWLRVAPAVGPATRDDGWWVDLSCGQGGGVELVQLLGPPYFNDGIGSIVRETTDSGDRWHVVMRPTWGPRNQRAPILARAIVADGETTCLLFSPGDAPNGAIRCTHNGGRTFEASLIPRIPAARDQPNVHGTDFIGTSFVGPSTAKALIEDIDVGTSRAPAARQIIWTTRDGGRSWRQTFVGRPRPVPQYR